MALIDYFIDNYYSFNYVVSYVQPTSILKIPPVNY